MVGWKPEFGKKKIFYGWVIVAVAFIALLVAYGIWYSFSLFYLPILDEFGWSRANTALIFSISSITYGFGSFIAGALFDRLGPRKAFSIAAIFLAVGLIGCSQANEIWHLYLSFGVLVAFGVAAMGWVPAVALVSNWFTRRRATAIGIAQAGGRETFLLMPLIQLLISNLGWRNAYLILAMVAPVIVIPLAITLLHHRPQDIGLLPDGSSGPEEKEVTTKARKRDVIIIDKEWASTEWTLLRSMKKYRLWFFSGAAFASGTTYGIVLTHQVAFMVDIGFTQMFAASLLVVYGIAATLGRASGFIADIIRRESAFTIGCAGVALGILVLVLTGYTSAAWMLYVYIILLGYFSGLNTPAYASSAADIFQGRHFGTVLGFMNIGYGIGSSIGSWLAGYIFDINGNYTLAFILAIFAISLGCASMWAAAPRKVRLVARIR